MYLFSVIMDDVGVIPMEIKVESEIPIGAGRHILFLNKIYFYIPEIFKTNV